MQHLEDVAEWKVTSLTGDYCRILTGNYSGYISLWDIRFGQKPLRYWMTAYGLADRTKKQKLLNEDLKIQSLVFDSENIFAFSKYCLTNIKF